MEKRKSKRGLRDRIGSDLVGEAIEPPGSLQVFDVVESDDRTFSVHARGDHLDVYYGRNYLVAFAIAPRTALRLAFWIFFRWWILGTWCGLRVRFWRAMLRRRAKAETLPSDARRSKVPSRVARGVGLNGSEPTTDPTRSGVHPRKS